VNSQRIFLVRHGETEWSRDSKHTSYTDVDLTEAGRAQSIEAGEKLSGRTFAAVYVSPMKRARVTCELAGWGDRAEPLDDLREWNYGEFEGLTTIEIRKQIPGWTIWTHGPKGGETPVEVGGRAERVLERVSPIEGDILLFGHGHMLRIVASQWIGIGVEGGSKLRLETGTISTLGYERETRVILAWNA
jgi:broad specificity phosphatase PhoE